MTIADENELPEHLNAAANEEVDYPSPWRVSVLYGDYGSRKTSTAATMVNERGLLLTADQSWKVLLNDRHREIREKLKIIPLTGLSQLKYISFENFDTVIWDTFSQSVDAYLDLLMDEATWGGKYREKIQTRNKELTDLHTESLALPDYRFTRDNFRPVLNRLFNETEAHIIFTSQMTTPIPGMGTNQQKRPSVPEATFKIVGSRADLIGQIKVSGTKCSIDVTQGVSQLGKTRMENIQGSMDQDVFIRKYKETVFK